jgi:hypothetical protein
MPSPDRPVIPSHSQEVDAFRDRCAAAARKVAGDRAVKKANQGGEEGGRQGVRY